MEGLWHCFTQMIAILCLLSIDCWSNPPSLRKPNGVGRFPLDFLLVNPWKTACFLHETIWWISRFVWFPIYFTSTFFGPWLFPNVAQTVTTPKGVFKILRYPKDSSSVDHIHQLQILPTSLIKLQFTKLAMSKQMIPWQGWYPADIFER